LALVNFMLPVLDWVANWWNHLQSGDKGTWAGGIFTALTLMATLAISTISLIISAITAIHQRSKSLKLREAEQKAAQRAHAERFRCWVAGRNKRDDVDLPVHIGELVVTLINASEQPFTKAVVEVGLKEAHGPRSKRWFTISAVPPGTSWFAFDGHGKRPETLLLSIWFLDNAVRSWCRSSIGTLEETKKEQRLLRAQGAVHVWLHHGDPHEAVGLEDAWAAVP
jgi:hypothetical protein